MSRKRSHAALSNTEWKNVFYDTLPQYVISDKTEHDAELSVIESPFNEKQLNSIILSETDTDLVFRLDSGVWTITTLESEPGIEQAIAKLLNSFESQRQLQKDKSFLPRVYDGMKNENNRWHIYNILACFTSIDGNVVHMETGTKNTYIVKIDKFFSTKELSNLEKLMEPNECSFQMCTIGDKIQLTINIKQIA